MQIIRCPFCMSDTYREVRTSAPIVQCLSCQTVYLRLRMSPEEMVDLYQNYAHEGSHMALPKTEAAIRESGLRRPYFVDRIVQYVTGPAGKVLVDIGCGWGAFLLEAKEKYGFRVMGIEVTRACVDFARSQLGLDVNATDFLEQEFTTPLHVVTMLHSFEHLPYPKQVLEKIFHSLEVGGIIAGAVPNFGSLCSEMLGESWDWLDPNYHYTHFTISTLARHLEGSGFTLLELNTDSSDFLPEKIHQAIRDKFGINQPQEILAKQMSLERAGFGETITFIARKP